MKIRFLGLIVHTQLEDEHAVKTQVAVLMQHKTHKAVLTVPTRYLGAATTAEGKAGPGVTCFALQGSVTNDFGPGFSGIIGIESLPRVEKMANGGSKTPHSGIGRRENHPDLFHALFEIPRGGDLNVEDYFEWEGTHNDNVGCVGRTVVYTKALQKNIVFELRHVDPKKNKIEILADADFVYVTNRCDCYDDTDISDQASYAQFFDPQPDSITPVTKGAAPKKCAIGTKEKEIVTCQGVPVIKPSRVARAGDELSLGTFENLDVDCTSSRYP